MKVWNAVWIDCIWRGGEGGEGGDLLGDVEAETLRSIDVHIRTNVS